MFAIIELFTRFTTTSVFTTSHVKTRTYPSALDAINVQLAAYCHGSSTIMVGFPSMLWFSGHTSALPNVALLAVAPVVITICLYLGNSDTQLRSHRYLPWFFVSASCILTTFPALCYFSLPWRFCLASSLSLRFFQNGFPSLYFSSGSVLPWTSAHVIAPLWMSSPRAPFSLIPSRSQQSLKEDSTWSAPTNKQQWMTRT